VSREVIDALIVPGRFELPPVSGVSYSAFFDGAGGSGGDSAVIALAHRELEAGKPRGVLDLVRERRPPFSPSDCVAEFAALCGRYNVGKVQGDRWAGSWPVEAFAAHRIEYETAALPKSEIYKNVLPALNSSLVELLDLPRLTAQLCSLERRTARGGRDSIDHRPGQHDDLANGVCGALLMVSQPQEGPIVFSDDFAAWAAVAVQARSWVRPLR